MSHGCCGAARSREAGRVLELIDVSKQFPGTPPVRALDDVSLSVREGELVAVVGVSGSGKSTLLNIVGTLDRPTSGQVHIEDAPTDELSDADLAGMRAARIGFVFQQFHLLEDDSVLDNVAAGLLYRGVRRSHRRSAAAEMLERVGLGHRMYQRPPQLSGGERQRVAIARAVVGDPAIVLADEPTGNLDSGTSAGIVEVLHHLNEDGSTIIVITHDQVLAGSFPRRVALSDGRVVDDTGSAGQGPSAASPSPVLRRDTIGTR